MSLGLDECGFEAKLGENNSYEVADEVQHKASDITEVVTIEGEVGLSEDEIEERRERFIEGIDFFETE